MSVIWEIREIGDGDLWMLRELSKKIADLWEKSSSTGYGFVDTRKPMMSGALLIDWESETDCWIVEIVSLGNGPLPQCLLLEQVQKVCAERGARLHRLESGERMELFRRVKFRAAKIFRDDESKQEIWQMTWDPKKAVRTGGAE